MTVNKLIVKVYHKVGVAGNPLTFSHVAITVRDAASIHLFANEVKVVEVGEPEGENK